MKKVFLSLAAIAVLSVVSCKKEAEGTETTVDTTTVETPATVETTTTTTVDTTAVDTTKAAATPAETPAK